MVRTGIDILAAVAETAFIFSPRCVEHDGGEHHPEQPDRARTIARAVRLAGLVVSPDPFPDFQIEFGPTLLKASKPLVELTPEVADEVWLRAVHEDWMIDHVRRACEWGGMLDQSDTPTCPESFEIAKLSAGGAMKACDFVMKSPGRRAFSAGRPPGHHAEIAHAMGFCLFNNAAIAARYLQREYGIEKIAIVDFDVHHGNGTQDVFDRDPTVLYVSIHEDPRVLYPGTGHAFETGSGPGVGTTLNVPMQPGSDDSAYEKAFDEKIVPALDRFAPQVLILSAGFDAHADDPLAHIALTDEAFAMMTRKLVGVAERHCEGRVVSVLEGGYNLRALGRSLVQHLVALSE
jgi:acetoin utilization deacetylase AcuC-like enzyme